MGGKLYLSPDEETLATFLDIYNKYDGLYNGQYNKSDGRQNEDAARASQQQQQQQPAIVLQSSSSWFTDILSKRARLALKLLLFYPEGPRGVIYIPSMLEFPFSYSLALAIKSMKNDEERKNKK